MKAGERFNPKGIFKGVYIPDAITRISCHLLSMGAKVCYARLCWFANDNGEAQPNMRDLSDSIGIHERQCRTYLYELEKQGFLGVTQRGSGLSNVYEFIWREEFDQSLRKGAAPEPKSDRQDTAEHSTESGSDRQDTAATDRQDTADPLSIKEVNLEVKPEEPHPTLPSGDKPLSTENQTPLEPKTNPEPESRDWDTDPSAPSEGLRPGDAEMELEVFLKSAYKRTRHDKFRVKQQDRRALDEFRQAEKNYSVESVRAGLFAYLAERSEFLAENYWPLRVFLNQIKQYVIMESVPKRTMPRREAADGQGANGTPRAVLSGGNGDKIAPAKPQAPLRVSVVLDHLTAIETWNRLVPSRPVKWNSRHDPEARLRSLWADPEFRDGFEEVCRKAAAIVKRRQPDDPWPNFRWILGRNEEKGDNWWRLKCGDLDGLARAPTEKPRRLSQQERVKAAIEEAKRPRA